jgi:thiosulfate reductase cytochrome b subunit
VVHVAFMMIVVAIVVVFVVMAVVSSSCFSSDRYGSFMCLSSWLLQSVHDLRITHPIVAQNHSSRASIPVDCGKRLG